MPTQPLRKWAMRFTVVAKLSRYPAPLVRLKGCLIREMPLFFVKAKNCFDESCGNMKSVLPVLSGGGPRRLTGPRRLLV